MNNIKVSVIIPVYNSEKYLKQCLDSVVNQTLKDIEIIVVNDGSTDNSLKIIQEYSNKYKNIKVINKWVIVPCYITTTYKNFIINYYLCVIYVDFYSSIKLLEKTNNKLVGAENILLDAVIWSRIFKRQMLIDKGIMFHSDIHTADDAFFHALTMLNANKIIF